jgi:GntR family transcriptional regulator
VRDGRRDARSGRRDATSDLPGVTTERTIDHTLGQAVHSIFGASPIPRYVQLADVLRQRIARGHWRTGDRLPSLDELGREFDVARVTVRQAMDVLVREGLVSPQQGRGTFVNERKADERRLHAVTTMGELAELYRDSHPQLLNLAEGAAAPALRPGEGLPAPRYFYMRRVHALDGLAYCVISIYLDERIFRRVPERVRQELVIPLLMSLRGVTIAKARQTLTIGTADVDEAGHLRVPVNAPVAHVRRVFNAPDDTVIYLAEVTYRGDFVRLEMDMRP